MARPVADAAGVGMFVVGRADAGSICYVADAASVGHVASVGQMQPHDVAVTAKASYRADARGSAVPDSYSTVSLGEYAF